MTAPRAELARRLARLGFALGAFALAAPAGAEPEPAPVVELGTVQLPDELDRVLRDYEEAWGARDAAALSALFTEDGFVLSPGRPPVRGRSAIERRYEGRGGPLALRAIAYATEGPLGYIIGGFGRTPGGPDLGKFTLILRQDDTGRWLIVSDMDNGNTRD